MHACGLNKNFEEGHSAIWNLYVNVCWFWRSTICWLNWTFVSEFSMKGCFTRLRVLTDFRFGFSGLLNFSFVECFCCFISGFKSAAFWHLPRLLLMQWHSSRWLFVSFTLDSLATAAVVGSSSVFPFEYFCAVDVCVYPTLLWNFLAALVLLLANRDPVNCLYLLNHHFLRSILTHLSAYPLLAVFACYGTHVCL